MYFRKIVVHRKTIVLKIHVSKCFLNYFQTLTWLSKNQNFLDFFIDSDGYMTIQTRTTQTLKQMFCRPNLKKKL